MNAFVSPCDGMYVYWSLYIFVVDGGDGAAAECQTTKGRIRHTRKQGKREIVQYVHTGPFFSEEGHFAPAARENCLCSDLEKMAGVLKAMVYMYSHMKT